MPSPGSRSGRTLTSPARMRATAAARRRAAWRFWGTRSFSPRSTRTRSRSTRRRARKSGTFRWRILTHYTCSVVALDADTGKLKWHYQFSPHNEFDWDSVQVPVLADMQWKGSPRKVMLWANRSGVFYVLDRTTGEFLLGKPFVKTNWVNG